MCVLDWKTSSESPERDRMVVVISKWVNAAKKYVNVASLEMITNNNPAPASLSKEHLVCWAYVELPEGVSLNTEVNMIDSEWKEVQNANTSMA